MRKTNTLFKSFSMIVIAILLVASLIITSSQSLNVHAESAHVHTEHCHHEDVEVGEFEEKVTATVCGCETTSCTNCFDSEGNQLATQGTDHSKCDAKCTIKNKKTETVTPGSITDPSKCPVCNCTVYACSRCYELVEGTNTYTSTCATKNPSGKCPLDITSQGWYDSLMQIVGIVDSLLNPILIIGGTAGMIFVIVLGVNFSKAESADKREEAKKRMINAIIGVVITLLALILIKLFTANAEEIVTWINRSGNA
ncbi:MAG: hypothetical protein IJE91_05050 [Clostridia bacterium]|nr:hypothetical protein [Clostridia bacterium]